MKKNVPAKQAKPIKQSRPDDKTIFGTWIDGYTTGDVGRIMSIFSEDLRYIAPCEPEQTFESLTNWFKYDVARKGPAPPGRSAPSRSTGVETSRSSSRPGVRSPTSAASRRKCIACEASTSCDSPKRPVGKFSAR